MPEGGAETSKLRKRPADLVPKFRSSTSKPTTNASGSSSSLRSVQPNGTPKRKHSPAPRLSHTGRKDLVTLKLVKCCCKNQLLPVHHRAPRRHQKIKLWSEVPSIFPIQQQGAPNCHDLLQAQPQIP